MSNIFQKEIYIKYYNSNRALHEKLTSLINEGVTIDDSDT